MQSKMFMVAISAASAALLAACAAGPSSSGGAVAAPTPSSLERAKIFRANANTVMTAYLASRITNDHLDNTQFLELSRRIFPPIQQEVYALEVSGIKSDPVQLEKTLSKYKAQFGAIPDKVYGLYTLEFGVEPSTNRFGFGKGENATYSSKDGGLVWTGSIGMDSQRNGFPIPPGFHPGKDFLNSVQVTNSPLRVVIPMAEEAYKREIYNVTMNGRVYNPRYDVLVVYQPKCQLEANKLSCAMQPLSTTVFLVNTTKTVVGVTAQLG